MAICAKTKHSMLRRCNGWDYRQPCIYQITLVLADRRSQALGRLVIPGAPAPGAGQGAPAPGTGQGASAPGTGQGAPASGTGQGAPAPGAEPAVCAVLEAAASSYIALSPAGEAVKREFWAIGEHHPEIKPLEIAIMPDHIHFIIWVTCPMAKPLGNAIGGFKAGSSKAAIGAGGLWAEGFQDTILFHEGQLEAMFNYLRDNARRLAVKRLMPDVFRVRRNLRVNLGLPPQAQDKGLPPQAQDKGLPPQAQDKGLPPQAQANREWPPQVQANREWPPQAQNRPFSAQSLHGSVPAAVAAGITGYFSAIGNHFLLESPNLLQVQCSRSYFAYRRIPKTQGRHPEHGTRGLKIAHNEKGEPIIEKATPEFEAKRDMLLAAARHGAVLISPCISDGEREIARLAFAAGLPVIALRNMGFSPLYKPGGRLFDQTADGKLLLLAPAAWPYQTEEKRMTRFDACVLNRITQLIAGDGSAEINYHGMKPNDIDRLVRDAVKGVQ